ncbi:hypothetical protein V498_00844 [Pseudogymnoascus sp. VKM F-4517 (FW-2822)]|nr:hypothetical protein V498_00844 [Pseudogymnoascus sp. VKM F-4517 (FW-2822)]
MAPPRHLKLTHPKKSLSSYSGSSFSSSSSSSPAPAQAPAPAPAPVPAPASDPAPDVPDCDNPLPTTEWVDSAERTEGWVWAGQPNGSRANSPVDTAATPPRQSGTPAPAETSAPKRSASAFRSRSLSAHGSPRPLPSAATIPAAAAPSDGERGIERKAPGGSIWSASPRPPARRAPVSVPDDAPAPSQSFSASGPRVLISISSGSKRSRDTGDDGAGERSSQRRRRSASHGRDSRRPSASVLGDEPASSPSPPVSGPRALGSTSSGSKRTRDVEDDGAGETSPQRRRTASAELQLRRSSASGSGSGSSRSTSGGERSRPAPAVDAAVLTDRVGSADLVAAPAQPVALSVVAAVNIVDIEPADGPAVAVEAAVEAAVAVNPVPLPDRAESRLQARIDALFARNRGRMRADRSTMVTPIAGILALAARAHHGSPGSPGLKARLRNPRRRVHTDRWNLWLSQQELIMDLRDLLDGKLA